MLIQNEINKKKKGTNFIFSLHAINVQLRYTNHINCKNKIYCSLFYGVLLVCVCVVFCMFFLINYFLLVEYYKFWLKSIDSFSDTEAPVIVVGTHADKLSKDVSSKKKA